MSKAPASAPPPKPATPPAAAPPRPAPPVPPAPTPEPVRAKAFADQVTAKYPDVKVEWMKERRLKVSTTPLRVKEVGLFIRDTLGFDHISTVSGVDWIA